MEFQNLYPQNYCRYLQQVLPKKKKRIFSPNWHMMGKFYQMKKKSDF